MREMGESQKTRLCNIRRQNENTDLLTKRTDVGAARRPVPQQQKERDLKYDQKSVLFFLQKSKCRNLTHLNFILYALKKAKKKHLPSNVNRKGVVEFWFLRFCISAETALPHRLKFGRSRGLVHEIGLLEKFENAQSKV